MAELLDHDRLWMRRQQMAMDRSAPDREVQRGAASASMLTNGLSCQKLGARPDARGNIHAATSNRLSACG